MFENIQWGEIFSSQAAITFYIALVLFGYRWLKRLQQWTDERWEGLITSAFLAAEKAGFLKSNAKLEYALNAFNKEYEETYGKEPSALDLKDAALDLARKAMEYKFAPSKLGL